MITRTRFGVLVGVFVVGVGIGFAQMSSGSADEQAIRKLDKEWSAAAQSKDIGKTVSYYAEEASAFPFNAPIATGKVQIQKVWTGLMAMPGFSLGQAVEGGRGYFQYRQVAGIPRSGPN